MVTFEQIQSIVCLGEGILPQTLKEKPHPREIAFARQTVWYFLKKYTKESLAMMGRHYGKDHATALHGIKTVKNLMDSDKQIAYKIGVYETRIQALVDFEKNIMTDKLIEVKELIKVRVFDNKPLNYDLITIYNKLVERENTEQAIKNDSK